MKETFKGCTSLKIVKFFPDSSAFNEDGKATRDSISKYADSCFVGVPSTCKIYVDANGLWNHLNSYGVELTKDVMGLADINMFVPTKSFYEMLLYAD